MRLAINQEHVESGTPARRDAVWNFLTILILVGMLLTGFFFLMIFQNPGSLLNPFPPPAQPAALVLPTATPTLRQLPPTWTPIPTSTATPTITPPTPVEPTDAIEVTPGALDTPAPETDAPNARYAFDLQAEVKSIDGSIFRPEHGCNWMGVAGQAFDLQGRPATGITVQVGGALGRNVIDLISLTGTALWYGQAGYEVFLADQQIASTNTLWIRLLDQSGLPLSGKVYFTTTQDCQRNLAVINFKQVK